MPPDLLDDLMAHAAAQNEAGDGGGQNIFVAEPGMMPGGFGHDEGEGVPDHFEPEVRDANPQAQDEVIDEDEDEDESDGVEDNEIEEEEEEIAVR